MSKQTIKWAAQLRNVADVTVRGKADLAYWSDYLRPYNLTPAQKDGHTDIILICGDARFKGIRFRELSVALILSEKHGAARDEAAFLLHAFNSCRFFAFCERVFFSTPYSHASVDVTQVFPINMGVVEGGRELLRVSMGSDDGGPRQEIFRGNEDWDGAVYLPHRPNQPDQTDQPGRVFFSEVAGEARKYAFDAGVDTLSINPTSTTDVLAQLVDSHFTPCEWICRSSSSHAKSKTYPVSRFA